MSGPIIGSPAVFVAISLLVIISVSVQPEQVVAAAPRALYVFGDSLVDSGNNNYLATTARADSPPYGIDFPNHQPTGRFSNGFNIPDLISQRLGAEPVLPYLSPDLSGEKLLLGANFASAGIGILNDTGFQFVNIVNIHDQLANFQTFQQKLANITGEEEAVKIVNGGLVLITVGGNDFVNNYFLFPITMRRLNYNLQDYCAFLISEYRPILKRLYDLNARRVLVTGTGPLGCAPAERALRSTDVDKCAEEPQQAAQIFNRLLVDMIKDLNKEVGSDVFVAVNAGELQNDFINNPQAFGFVTSKIACCGQGPYNGIGLCTILSNLCPNRSLYAFWDPFHPSERANQIIVETIMTGDERYMSPMNLSTILELDSMKTH